MLSNGRDRAQVRYFHLYVHILCTSAHIDNNKTEMNACESDYTIAIYLFSW